MITFAAYRLYGGDADPFARAAADICELAGIEPTSLGAGQRSVLEMLVEADVELDAAIRGRVPPEWLDDFDTAWCVIEAAREMERRAGWLL